MFTAHEQMRAHNILDSHNIALAKTLSALHLDHDQPQSPKVFGAMLMAGGM